MKNKNDNKKGFTLIELLVVVLIIGILAAVALPQYQKAVEKSRLAEARTLLNAIYKGYQLCILNYGEGAEECSHTNLIENMDIDFPVERSAECGMNICYKTNYWNFDADSDEDWWAEHLQNNTFMIKLHLADGKMYCVEEEQEGSCKPICGQNRCELK